MQNVLKMLLVTHAHAQSAPSAQAQNPFMQFAPLVVVFIIFYFLMIRPQKKKFDEEQVMLSNLQKGDEVYTKSGIIGTIYGLTDKIITLEVESKNDSAKIKVLRSQVGGLLKSILEADKK